MNAVYNGTFSAGQRDDVPYDLRSPLLPFRHSPWLADGYSDDNRPEKPRPSSYIDSMLRFFHAFPQTNRFKLWSQRSQVRTLPAVPLRYRADEANKTIDIAPNTHRLGDG